MRKSLIAAWMALPLSALPTACVENSHSDIQSSKAPINHRDLHPGRINCSAESVQKFVGRMITPERERLMGGLARSTMTRVVNDAEPLTLEFSAERLTIVVDDDHRIRKIWCG
jgi:hypothetical protein